MVQMLIAHVKVFLLRHQLLSSLSKLSSHTVLSYCFHYDFVYADSTLYFLGCSTVCESINVE